MNKSSNKSTRLVESFEEFVGKRSLNEGVLDWGRGLVNKTKNYIDDTVSGRGGLNPSEYQEILDFALDNISTWDVGTYNSGTPKQWKGEGVYWEYHFDIEWNDGTNSRIQSDKLGDFDSLHSLRDEKISSGEVNLYLSTGSLNSMRGINGQFVSYLQNVDGKTLGNLIQDIINGSPNKKLRKRIPYK